MTSLAQLSPLTAEITTPATKPIRHKRHFHETREKSWIIVVALAISALLTWVYLSRTPNIYQARAVIEVSESDPNVINIKEPFALDFKNLESVKTVEQKLNNRVLLQRIIDKYALDKNSTWLPHAISSSNPHQYEDALTAMIHVKLRRGTRLIDIVVDHPDPIFAQKLATWVASEFVSQSKDLRDEQVLVASAFLRNETQKLKAKVENSEQALQAYREKTQSVSLEEQQNIVVERLKDMNSALTQAKTRRLQMHPDFLLTNKPFNKPEDLLTIPSVGADPMVLQLKGQIAEQEARINELLKRYRAAHPQMAQAHSQLAGLKVSLHEAAQNHVNFIRNNYEGASQTEKKLEEALAEQEKLALDLNKESIQYNSLSRESEANRTLYDTVLKRLKETELTQHLNSTQIRVVEPALAPLHPIRPHRTTAWTISLTGGLLLGFGLVFVLNAANTSIKTVDDAEHALELPVLAAIPIHKQRNIFSKKFAFAHEYPSSPTAEAFRSLRASVSLLFPDSEKRVILFTSSIPNEGKTYCAINYAASLAQQGVSTLLIDADVRGPQVEKIFFHTTMRRGVTDYLLGREDASVASTPIENLYVMPAGTALQNPAERLSQERLTMLITESLQHFDRVIIDSAPVLSVSDSLFLIPTSNLVCLVVEAGKTPMKAVRRTVQLIQRVQPKPMGMVLNRVPLHRSSDYYHHYSASHCYSVSDQKRLTLTS
jgi:polysaccharide biosynthesis transport protein